MLKNLKTLWLKITGSPEQFILEARLFHTLCVISQIGLIAGVFVNIINGRPILLVVIMLLTTATFFYISRFKNKLVLSVVLYSFISNVLLTVNFYVNSGIQGSSLLSLLLSLFLTIIVVPKKQYLFFVTLNLFLVIGSLIISYKFPDLIDFAYQDVFSQYMEIGSSYVTFALMIFFLLSYLRSSYNREKELTEQKAAELYISNQTKNKLLSILAHDLRSPLSSIQNYLEVLSEYDIDESEKKNIQADLLKETKNTQQMLSNLLSWGKSQMGGVVVNLSEINLKETLMPGLLSQQSMAIEKGIELENDVSDLIFVLADSDMLQLIIRNLINNAIKFTPEKGKISISAKPEGDSCIIAIDDNGNGIPYQMQADLFSLKAKSTYGTRREKGIGLGLAMCKEYTEIQNGKIWFKSEPGIGTTFYISLILCSINPKKMLIEPVEINIPGSLGS
jgi:two-component system sensor histidine kinase/response regulator